VKVRTLLAGESRISRIAATIAVATGALVLIGWVLDVPVLKSVLPGLSTMKVNTALALVLAGVSLGFSSVGWSRRLATTFAVAAGMLGLLTVLEYLVGRNFGIDQLLIRDSAVGSTFPGRPGINTALCFVLLSAGLLRSNEWRRTAEACVLGAALIALTAIVGYVYSAASLSGIASYTRMALHTALVIVVLCAGTLARGPDGPFIAIVRSHGPGGAVVRRILPIMLAVLLALGWLRLKGQVAGLYGTEFGVAILVLTSMVALCVITLVIAARLNHAESMYRSFVENSPYGIMRTLPIGTILAANPALVRMLGYESEAEILPLKARDLYVHPEDRPIPVAQLLARGELILELRWKRKDGAGITVRASGRVIRDAGGNVEYFDNVIEDVTQQRVLEMQLQQARKMEAIGQLAGGVAHDFNNLLTVILGSADLLLTAPSAGSSDREEIGDIRRAAMRAAELTRQLLAFSRQQVLQPKVLDLNHVVEGMEKMLGRLIGAEVDLRTRLAPDLGAVRADPSQLEQIILNLAVNARDAMPEGGELTVETANANLDAPYVAAHGPVPPGSYVMLAVSDTGVGMDQATQARVFEPFFTTKEMGKGTGLGLATVYGIVKQSGGFIWLYSEPGQGATFKIYLPRVVTGTDAATAVTDPGVLIGTETVLLVEDEDAVRTLTQRVLEGQGYTVLVAEDGPTALALAGRHSGAIHLLISDVVMPKMRGREVASRLAELRPETKVLFISGYAGEAATRRGILEAGMAFLQKPFTVEGLARKVREVLDG
jgi:two-component system, cell cycle sensor histidine kinase and response regulator CckA